MIRHNPKNLFILTLTLSLILNSFSSIAQQSFKKGYIITNSGDTVTGLINLKSDYSNGKECEFKETMEGYPVKYSPRQIKGYRIENDKFYVSREIDLNDVNEKVFLEFLLDGVVDLFFMKDFSNGYYFIEKDGVLYPMSNDAIEEVKDNDKKYVRNSNQYLGVLTYVFQDANDLASEIPATEFRPASLIKITEKYHNLVVLIINALNMKSKIIRHIIWSYLPV
jgi:hypothetical protein